jgi:EmrB/QacA subfamily drug resistance transporter
LSISSPSADAATAYDRRWWTLGVLCLSLLIVFGGNASLNVAIPTLSKQLHATTSQLQWVVAVYSLVFAGLLFSTGAIGDRYGRKGALQLGLLMYLVGALAATLSSSMWQLIACRAFMGAAAALIMPSTLSILVNVFPPGERAKAIAIWASFLGAVGAIAPPISGLLLSHFWFGSVFLINVPIIAVTLIAGRFLVPRSRDPKEAALDPTGAVLSVVGLVALVYGLIQAPDKGWGSTQTLGAFAISAVVLLAFVMWELRVEEPMLDVRFFRNPAFSVGTGGMLLVFLGMYGLMFLLTQYFQLVHGFSALNTALRLLPMSPIMLLVAPLTPRLSARFGANRVVGVGMLLAATGFIMFGRVRPGSGYAYVLVSLFFFIAGMALTMSPMTSSIMSAVPARRAGAGSAMNDATRELGAALGVAVIGSIAASKYASQVKGLTAQLPAATRGQARQSLTGALASTTHLPHATALAVQNGAKLAFVDGMRLACTVGAILAVLAAGLVVRYLPNRVSVEASASADAPAADPQMELPLAAEG